MPVRLWTPPKNPPGLTARHQSWGRVIDDRPRARQATPRLRKGTALPDDLLISTWVQLGCPRGFAEQLRHSEELRYTAAQVYFLVERAAAGGHVTHPETGESIRASELVDSMRAEYETMRKLELISDEPEHTVGLFER